MTPPTLTGKLITPEDIENHNKEGGAWAIVHGKVYDVKALSDLAPCGAEELLAQAGQDATKAFDAVKHSDNALKMAQKFLIGTYSEVCGGVGIVGSCIIVMQALCRCTCACVYVVLMHVVLCVNTCTCTCIHDHVRYIHEQILLSDYLLLYNAQFHYHYSLPPNRLLNRLSPSTSTPVKCAVRSSTRSGPWHSSKASGRASWYRASLSAQRTRTMTSGSPSRSSPAAARFSLSPQSIPTSATNQCPRKCSPRAFSVRLQSRLMLRGRSFAV